MIYAAWRGCVRSGRLGAAVGVALLMPTPVTHLGNLCLGSPRPSGFVCLEVLVPDVSVCEHACMCVCVCMHARVCVSTGPRKGPTKLSTAVACPSGPHAIAPQVQKEPPLQQWGESPVFTRSRDTAVSQGQEVGTGHGDKEGDMCGTDSNHGWRGWESRAPPQVRPPAPGKKWGRAAVSAKTSGSSAGAGPRFSPLTHPLEFPQEF